MFDGAGRLVICNERYIRLYGVSADIVKPGCSLLEMLEHRRQCGSFENDPKEYDQKIRAAARDGEKLDVIIELTDGRVIEVVNQPMVDGGWVATHEDITERVHAENKIKKQEQHLVAALKNISQGVCMFDTAQRLIICNKQYVDLYGLTHEQTKPGTSLRTILEHRIASGNAPEDHENYIKERLNEVSINQPYQIVNRLRDGRYVSVVHRPMAGGGWVATHEDVTETRRREESFRLLFEGNPVPMWVIDRESLRFIAVNAAAVAHYGYSREQFMAMTVPDLRPADDRARFTEFLRTLVEDQLAENIGQHRKADGTQIDVAIYSRALAYDGHNARLAAIHDITKTKRTEDELRRTKIFLNAIVEHVPVPIVVRDVAGCGLEAHGSQFTLFNRAYEDLTGDSRVYLIGKTAHEIYSKERADLIVRSDSEALSSAQVVVHSRASDSHVPQWPASSDGEKDRH